MKEKNTIQIGKPYVTNDGDGLSRLCADVTFGDTTRCLKYGVEERYSFALTQDRADSFVAAMIHIGLQLGADIVCEAPVSRRLLYKLNQSYIPAMTFAFPKLKEMNVVAKPVAAASSRGGVGCSCSFGLNSLYTLLENGDGEYPVTHLCIFNAGTFEEDENREIFREHCRYMESFAKERELDSIFVDTNLHEVLNERYLDVYGTRQMSVILALQGLFKAYHYSATVRDKDFRFDDYDNAYYDPLSVDCLSTDSLRFFLSGASVSRIDKLIMMADHPKEAGMIHPCFRRQAWEGNCGKCTKCRRDMLAIYAAGKTEQYSEAFDFQGFEKNIATNLAFVMAESSRDVLMKEVLNYWKSKGLAIPEKAYAYAKQFKISMENLERSMN